MPDLDTDVTCDLCSQADARRVSTSAEHRMSFAPLRLASRSLLFAQCIQRRKLPAMMRNVVTAATSAAPQITPMPEAIKVGGSPPPNDSAFLAKHDEVSKDYLMFCIGVPARTACILLA